MWFDALWSGTVHVHAQNTVLLKVYLLPHGCLENTALIQYFKLSLIKYMYLLFIKVLNVHVHVHVF